MTVLRIFLNQLTASSHPWWLFDRSHSVIRHDTDGLENMPLADEIEVIIPTDWVSFASVKLPSANRRKVIDALAFLIEDQLITSPEQVHVAILNIESNDQAALACIEKQVLSNVIDYLQQHNIAPTRILPAALLTQFQADCWMLVHDDAHFFLSTTQHSGHALGEAEDNSPPIELQLLLAQARATQTLPKKIIAYGKHAATVAAWFEADGLAVETPNNDWKLHPVTASGFNLLQGDYVAKGQKWAVLQNAKPALLLLGATLITALICASIDLAIKSYERQKLDQAMKAVFLTAFPDAKNVVDAPLQMQRKLNEMQHASGDIEGDDFLPLLANITKHTGGLTQATALNYNDAQLTVSVQAANQAEAQALAQKLHLPGYIVAIENMKTQDTLVTFDAVFKAENQ